MKAPDSHEKELIPNALLERMRRQVVKFSNHESLIDSCESIEAARARVLAWSKVTETKELPELFRVAERDLVDDINHGCNHLAAAYGETARDKIGLVHKSIVTVKTELAKDYPSLQMVQQALNFACGEMKEVVDTIHDRHGRACSIATQDEEFAHKDDDEILHYKPLDALMRAQGLYDSLKRGSAAINRFLSQRATER